ncbi:MAG: GntR family transcriptional regulator [Treponemataceae bacterium]
MMINNTLSERVFEHIKDDILMGVMKPGDRLLYEKLAEKLNVSLTPVKEALLMLEQEGLVKTVPRKGAYVTQLTNRDVLEYTQIRLALECLAVDIFCEKKKDTSDFSILRQINRELELATKSKDTGECMKKDIKFHYAIVTLCDNKRLSDLINQLPLSNFYGHMGTQQIMVERGKLILIEHSQIIEALAAKDATLTKALLKSNILEPQVDYLKQLPAEEDRKSK